MNMLDYKGDSSRFFGSLLRTHQDARCPVQKKAFFTDVYLVEKWSDAPVRQKVPGNDEHVLSWRQEMVTVEYQF